VRQRSVLTRSEQASLRAALKEVERTVQHPGAAKLR